MFAAAFKIFRGRNIKITMNMNPMVKYVKVLTDNNSTHKRQMLRDWVTIYKEFMVAHFRSKGHGTWPPLNPKTKKRVRKRSRQILRDSDTLFNVWLPANAPGLEVKELKNGIRLGYGGGARHPIAKRLTIERLATIHSIGAGRAPKRKIVVEPNTRTLQRMQNRLKRAAIDAKRSARMK